jgi:hypothetical protein
MLKANASLFLALPTTDMRREWRVHILDIECYMDALCGLDFFAKQ